MVCKINLFALKFVHPITLVVKNHPPGQPGSARLANSTAFDGVLRFTYKSQKYETSSQTHCGSISYDFLWKSKLNISDTFKMVKKFTKQEYLHFYRGKKIFFCIVISSNFFLTRAWSGSQRAVELEYQLYIEKSSAVYQLK